MTPMVDGSDYCNVMQHDLCGIIANLCRTIQTAGSRKGEGREEMTNDLQTRECVVEYNSLSCKCIDCLRWEQEKNKIQ